MPSWCKNTLTIAGPEDERLRWKEFHGTEEGELTFSACLPRPKELEEVDGEALLDWGRKHWGTGWGPSLSTWTDAREVWFQTAWSPPVPWLKTMAKQWPQLGFHLAFQMEYDECRPHSISIKDGDQVTLWDAETASASPKGEC